MKKLTNLGFHHTNLSNQISLNLKRNIGISEIKRSIFKSVFLVFTVLSSSNIFADAWTATGSCSWFTNRYKAHAGIHRAGAIFNWCSDTKANCSGVEVLCQKNADNNVPPFQVVWARAYAKRNANENFAEHFGGYDGTDQWYAGADVSKNMPKYSQYPIIFNLDNTKGKYSSARISVGDIVFDLINRKVILHNINAQLNINPRDLTNDFTGLSITILKSTKDKQNQIEEDEQSFLKRRIWHSNGFLNNGKLLLGKDIANAKIATVKKLNIGTEVSINIEYLEVKIPASVNIDEIEVLAGVDNGNKGMGISEKFAPNPDATSIKIDTETVPVEKLDVLVNNYPNPIGGSTSQVNLKIPEDSKIIVDLVDYQGNTIENVFIGEAKKDEDLLFDVNISKLKTGIGYIRIKTKSTIIMRKIILQK